MIDLEKLEDQVAELLSMQNQLEEHISGPDWRTLGHNYRLCIIMEACEAIDHFGWKHWKAHETDVAAVKMELVDILHFWLAHCLSTDVNSTELAGNIAYGMSHLEDMEEATFIMAMAGVIGAVSSIGHMPTVNFFVAMDRVGMTWDEMRMLYLTKHTLNTFRRDHGYKEGTYIKDWDGIEDNVHAHALAKAQGSELMVSVLYDELDSAYQVYALGLPRPLQ